MKLSRPSLVFAAALSALASTLGAQEPSPNAPVTPVSPAQAAKAGVLAPNISLTFAGGTLAQLIAAVAKTPSGPLNLIGDPSDLAVAIPPFSLNNASSPVFIMALSRFLEVRGMSITTSGLTVPGSMDVYVVRKNAGRPKGMGDAFESMQLAPFLEQQTIDDIVGAVRAAWELDPAHDASALRLKYHPATTLLLVSGPQEAIMVAQKVVLGTLKRTAEKNAAQFVPPPNREKK